MVKAIGSLAEKRPEHGTEVKGLLVSKDFSYTLLDPKDLRDFTGLGTSTVKQKQSVAIGVDWAVVRWHLEGMYGEVEGDDVLTVSCAERRELISDYERGDCDANLTHVGGTGVGIEHVQ